MYYRTCGCGLAAVAGFSVLVIGAEGSTPLGLWGGKRRECGGKGSQFDVGIWGDFGDKFGPVTLSPLSLTRPHIPLHLLHHPHSLQII